MEIEQYFRFLIALVFVLALIGGLAWLLRRFGLSACLAGARRGGRLRIVEVTTLDARRKLVLLARDGVEHLVLLGPGQDLVIEAGITAGEARADPPPGESTPAPARQP